MVNLEKEIKKMYKKENITDRVNNNGSLNKKYH